jgi:hypothetical protein
MKTDDEFDADAPLPAPAAAVAAMCRQLASDLMDEPVPPMADRVRHALALRASVASMETGGGCASEAVGHRPGASPRWRRWAAWGLSGAALCALALIGSVLLLLLSPQDSPELAARQLGSGFVTVASAERWQQLLREDGVASAWLVPTELPRERLAALGLPFDPARAGDRVSAELLMHPSGEVLAVRVLGP